MPIAKAGLQIMNLIVSKAVYSRSFTSSSLFQTPRFVSTQRFGRFFSSNESVDPTKAQKWRLSRLNHVAIAVPDLQSASILYRDVFGARVSAPQTLPDHGVTVVFVELDNCKIELLKPLDSGSPIQNFLTKNPSGGIHHICIEVDDVEAAMRDLRDRNIRTLSAQPTIGAHGLPVVFLHPKDLNGVLTELEQEPK